MYLLNGTLEYYLNKYLAEGSAAIINDGKVIGCKQEEIPTQTANPSGDE